MTAGTVAFVNAFRSRQDFLRTFDQPENAWNFAGIYDEESRGRVERCATPSGAAVEARKNDCTLARRRLELIPTVAAAKFAKTFQHVAEDLRRTAGQHFFSQDLTSNRRRQERQRLCVGG